MLQQYVEIITWGFLFIDAIVVTRDISKLRDVARANENILLLFFSPEFSFDYLLRISAFFILSCCLYTLVSIRFYRKTPLTILRTEINININRRRDRAVFEKTQTIRANVPNVTAYFTTSSPSCAAGKITDVLMYSDCPGAKLKDEIEFTNEIDSRGFEAIHTFGRALRYRWYMLLVPKFLMNKSFLEIPLGLRKNLTIRTQEFTCIDEFNQQKPSIEFTARDYPQRKIYISIEFEGDLPNNIKTRRVALHGMVDVPATRVSRGKIKIYIGKLFQETLRISWDEEVHLPLLEQSPSRASTKTPT